MSDFVRVYVLKTGRKQTIPRAWLDHPILGAPFSKTPSQKKQDPNN